MSTNFFSSIASIVNLGLVLWLAIITRRYAKATERILEANQKSLEMLRTACNGTTYTWAATLLSAPELVRLRRKLFEELPQYKGTLCDMPNDVREAFEQVCRTYDLVGIACYNGMLPHSIIAKEWGNSLIRLHELCNRHLSELRADRGQMFWNNFTELYEEAKRVWH